MARVKVYFEIDGIAEDEHGNPCPTGLQIDYGEVPDMNVVPYEDLPERLDIQKVLKFLHMDIPVSAVRIITPEEYDRKYGDE